jgi:predicted molibdopterin-dependent oxidoreductase YjgC
MLDAAAARRLKLLWIFHHDLSRSAWAPAQIDAALATPEMVVFQGTNANRTSAAAHLVLPSAAYVEREGTFTNFEGRVQRFRTALDALGEARPDWEVFSGLAVALGLPDPALTASRADQVFQTLAGAVPAYAGMSYRALGDGGLVVGS